MSNSSAPGLREFYEAFYAAVAGSHANTEYNYWDYTAKDHDHAQRKERIARELRPRFEAESNLLLYNSHIGEAQGIQQAVAAGAHASYLYLVQKS